jgi:hypothetical protein
LLHFQPLRQRRILLLFPGGKPDKEENESNSLRKKVFEFQKSRTWGINKRSGIKCDESEPVLPVSWWQIQAAPPGKGTRRIRGLEPSALPKSTLTKCPQWTPVSHFPQDIRKQDH